MNKRLVIVIALALVALVVAGFLALRSSPHFASERPTLLFFYSPLCSFCKEIMPTVNGIEREYAGRLNVVYVNIDETEGQTTARGYGVIGTPTIVLLDRDGEQTNVLRGTIPAPLIYKAVDELSLIHI